MKNRQGATLAPGERVRARRQWWRVEHVDRGDACDIVTLKGTGRDNSGRRQRLLSAIDRLDTVAEHPRLRRVGATRWRRAVCAALLRDDRFGRLSTLRRADVDLLPYQLAPALALLDGDASRLLIADEVGLGKTIQAGLIVAELSARGVASRILILSPPGLRDQWLEELRARFCVEATLVDALELRRRERAVPPDVNPWQLAAITISSLDFVKRPDVLSVAAAVHWDLLIVDEAHHASLASDRREALRRLASTAGHVVLLTGTPHSGDPDAYAALCALGEVGTSADDPLRIFRRTRAMVGLSRPRRVLLLAVRQSAHERRMHAALARFCRAVCVEHDGTRPDVSLGLAMLRKRACSSARSLEQSVRRRLESFTSPVSPPASQLPLPWSEDGEHEADDEPPPWNLPTLADAADERRLLTIVADTASQAAAHESKLAALRRLLRRVREPVVIFTEYRDTLTHVQRSVAPHAAVIHGGLNRAERRAALERFARGGVLLATDAAGEGLNLQRHCRVVVNFELPWNPVRLEQRLGRVDRLGQRQTVHAVHLVARGTTELRVLQRLAARVEQANVAVGIANPLCSRTVDSARQPVAPDPRAAAECDRLLAARAIEAKASLAGQSDGALPPNARDIDGWWPHVWIRRSPIRRLMTRTHGRPLVIYQSRVMDGAGGCVGTRLLAVLLAPAQAPPDLAALEVIAAGLEAQGQFDWPLMSVRRSYWRRRLAREQRIDWSLNGAPPRHFQPGLFDARERLIEERLHEQRTRAATAAAIRIDRLMRLAETVVEPLRPILVVGV